MNHSVREFFTQAAALLILLSVVGGGLAVAGGIALGNETVVCIGLVPIVLVVAWIVITVVKARKEKQEGEAQFKHFLKKAEKIRINLDDIVIKSNCYQHEVVKGSGTKSRNVLVAINHNHLSLAFRHRGHHIAWEDNIDMVPQILKMKFALQKETWLHFDERTGSLYMDLEFLRS